MAYEQVVLHDLRERLVLGASPVAGDSRAHRQSARAGVSSDDEQHRLAPASPRAPQSPPPPPPPPPSRAVREERAANARAVALLAALLALAAALGALISRALLPAPTARVAPGPAFSAADVAALRARVAALEARLEGLDAASAGAPAAAAAAAAAPTSCGVCGASQEGLARYVSAALDLFWADRTGRPDYAAAGAGGRVLAHSPLVAWAVAPSAARSPLHPRADELLLTPSLEAPGHCLPLDAATGAWVDVALREPLYITAASLEHVHRDIALDASSAPRRFDLLALREGGGGEGAVLVSGSYDAQRGAAVQTFAAGPAAADAAVARVRLALRSNHGGDYICLYRLRVHGTPAAKPLA